jgi:hypothetical protein
LGSQSRRLGGHACEIRTGDETGYMMCDRSTTTGAPPYICFLERGPGAIFADCRPEGSYQTVSAELPLDWWPSP